MSKSAKNLRNSTSQGKPLEIIASVSFFTAGDSKDDSLSFTRGDL